MMLSISTFREAAVPDQQSLIDYINAIAVVSAWSVSVTSLRLPALVNPPPGYADFAAALVRPKMDALAWRSSIIVQFGDVAGALAALDPFMTESFSTVKTALGTLANNPGDAPAKTAAEKGLALLSRFGSGAALSVTQLVTLISALRGRLASDAVILKRFADLTAAADTADAEKVAQCQASIKALEDMINNENQIMTLQKLANWDFAIFLVGVGICLGVILSPVGSLALSVGTTGTLALTAATVRGFVSIGQNEDFTDQMKQQQQIILNLTFAIGGLNSQIVLLKTVAGQIASLTDDKSGVANAITKVAAFWFNLQTFLMAMDTALTVATVNLQAGDIASASSWLTKAADNWNSAVLFTDLIKNVKYDIKPGVLTMPLPANAIIGDQPGAV